MSNQVTASLLIIGNEILSGRTLDKNTQFLAQQFSQMGIQFVEVRVVPDSEAEVVAAVNTLRAKTTYLFTTGGIGPTHDDITTACIAKAFGVSVVRDVQAQTLLEGYYPPDMRNDARMRMADVPQGASLIPNPVSAAPGYRMENVFTMAGVPTIMQAMFAHIRPTLQHGEAYVSRSLRVWTGEGNLADMMTALQASAEGIDIGSYPFTQAERLGTSIVLRGTDVAAIDACFATLLANVQAMGHECVQEA